MDAPAADQRRLLAIRRLPPRLRIHAIHAALAAPLPPDSLAVLALDLLELAGPPIRNSLLSRSLRVVVGPPISTLARSALATRLATFTPEARALTLSLEGLDWPATLVGNPFPIDDSAIRSISQLAAMTGQADLAGALASALNLKDSGAIAHADAALQVLALAAIDASPADIPPQLRVLGLLDRFAGLDPAAWPRADAESRSRVASHVAAACASFEDHRRRGPMIAAILLLDRAAARTDAPLAQWFGRFDHPTHAALKGALRWCRLPVARLRAWEWAWRDDLAAAASDRLARAATTSEHELILARASLVLRPARARRLAEIDLPRVNSRSAAPDAPVPGRATLAELSSAARLGLPRFVSALRGDSRQRQAALEPLIIDPDPLVRHAAARALPIRALDDLCFDEDSRIARSAYIARSASGMLAQPRAGEAEPDRVERLLARSRHDTVRAWARHEHAQLDAPPWNALHHRLAFRRRLARDPSGVHAELSRALRDEDPARRFGAIMLIRRLDLAQRFEDEILNAADAHAPAHDEWAARAVASAIAALGDVTTAESGTLLARALAATDGRVRANAVEALARHARRGLPALLAPALSADDHHRVRGNTIKALLLDAPTPAAPDALRAMLDDSREMHRAAAAWVAGRALRAGGRERLGEAYAPLLARVCEVARFDESQRVRRRAILAAAQAQTELRASIAEAAPQPAGSTT